MFPGDYSGSNWIAYRENSMIAFYSGSSYYAFIFDSSQSMVFIINKNTKRSLIFCTSTGVGYYADVSATAAGIYHGQAIINYIHAIRNITIRSLAYRDHATHFKLKKDGRVTGGESTVMTYLRTFWRKFWNVDVSSKSTLSLKRWTHFVVLLRRWANWLDDHETYELSVVSVTARSIGEYILEDIGVAFDEDSGSDESNESRGLTG